ncbi:MAG: peptide chain release factor 2 [Candidatus Curtissbacteria bacterium]|nr:peptide chain release factor 2 [bacterium]MDZ4210008.1 peptide chain release factor 2 [Candidatus Curtissbacteria bacterium]
MEAQDYQERIDSLKKKLKPEESEQRVKELEDEMSNPDFWQDQAQARAKTQELSDIKKDLDALEMLDLYLAEGELGELEKALRQLELKIFLSGTYDKSNAILTIHAGQGGVEAMDWSEMLQRMYMRYAEKKGWAVDLVDFTRGDEAGIKTATLTIAGKFAYGYLKGEAGVHRLVRQSPFNADKLRQTSFALVEVLPEIEDLGETKIKDDDLEWDFYRASSHGGQNVQKVSTAVRLRHMPSGVVVTSQSERYQEQNRKIALSLLTAKLWVLEQEKMAEEERKLKGEYKTVGWGNQIRSYVLHPYKMIKDLRTGVETSDPDKVLDGELDLFVEAELKNVV